MYTNLLTPWCRALLEKLTGLQLVKKFPAFHGTRRFITALTSVRHISLSWARPIQSIYPHPTSWRSILLLTFQVPIFIPLCLLRDASPGNTPPPPGDPSVGVVSLRIVLSPEQALHLWMFLNISVLQGRVVSTSPNPQAGGPLLIGCPRLLIQFIRNYPPYRRPFLYPQPEDAPCRGDRDPLHGEIMEIIYKVQEIQIKTNVNVQIYKRSLQNCWM